MPENTATRQCPIDGCETEHPRSLLMCRRHWYMVPPEHRKRLWRAYRADGAISDAYIEARDVCIAEAERAEATT